MKQEQYDVAVIGSGMAGMCLASLMAHAGHRVLVVERLSFIGGRFSTMDYKGYRISTGGVCMQTGGPAEQIFNEVGAKLDLRFLGGTSYHIEGKFHILPERGRMEKLISLVSKDETEVKRVMDAFRRGLKWMEPSECINFRDWLLQFTQNEKILAIFQADISALAMVNADELPACEHFRMLKNNSWVDAGMGLAPGGNISLMESLADVIRAGGGDIWTSSPAKKILVEKGVASGIVVESGGEVTTIRARAVVSNVGPKKTVELVGKENLDRGYLKHVGKSGPPAPQALIWLGSDRPLMETSFSVIYDARRVNSVTCLSEACPELAPKRRHLYLAGAGALSATQPVDFRSETEICIQDLREIIPGFDQHVEILLPQFFRGDWPGYRAVPGSGLPEKTPVLNLYNVGDGVAVPGTVGCVGTNVCAVSARAVAKDLVKRLR